MKMPERNKKGPEAKIQEEWIKFLRAREWLVKETHGNMFQKGFPDLYIHHPRYGARWVEVKNPEAYSFTPAQKEWFPQFMAVHAGIWVLFKCCEEQYNLLFKPANIGYFLYGKVYDF